MDSDRSQETKKKEHGKILDLKRVWPYEVLSGLLFTQLS